MFNHSNSSSKCTWDNTLLHSIVAFQWQQRLLNISSLVNMLFFLSCCLLPTMNGYNIAAINQWGYRRSFHVTAQKHVEVFAVYVFWNPKLIRENLVTQRYTITIKTGLKLFAPYHNGCEASPLPPIRQCDSIFLIDEGPGAYIPENLTA